MDVAKTIKKIRMSTGLNQYDFSKKVGLSHSYISHLEKGLKSPTISTLNKISLTAGIPIPLMFLYAIDESDIKEEKREYYKMLKPNLDNILESLF